MDRQKLEGLVAPILESHNLELDALETVRAGKRTVLRVVVDSDGVNGAGPSLDEIAKATRDISQMLDETPAAGKQSFTLEVSTRGLNRPLTELKHYRRNIGRLVKVNTEEQSFVGRIQGVGQDSVLLVVEGADVELSLADIKKALIQVEMNRNFDSGVDADFEESEDL